MAESKKRTPAYVSYKTFKNAIVGLDHVPTTIDYSLYSSMNGSTRNVLFSALKFFELIGENGEPTDEFELLASGDETKWKSVLKTLLERFYADQLDVLKSGTVAGLRKSFGDDVGASIITPACRFLIAAATEAKVPVSPTIAKAKVGSTSPRKGRTSGRTPRQNGGGGGGHTPPPKSDMVEFPIPLQGKPSGRIEIPTSLSEDDMLMVRAIVNAVEEFAKQEKGGLP